jgi:hypothetical protein
MIRIINGSRTSIVALLTYFSVALPALATSYPNYQDWWWNPSQSGQGLNVGQQENILFVSWFTYDGKGTGAWLTTTITLVGNTGSGDLYLTTGPKPGMTFDPNQVTRAIVGTGTLTFSDLHNGTWQWTFNGKSGTLAISRQTWAARYPDGGLIDRDHPQTRLAERLLAKPDLGARR